MKNYNYRRLYEKKNQKIKDARHQNENVMLISSGWKKNLVKKY